MWLRKRTDQVRGSAPTQDLADDRGDHREIAMVVAMMVAFALIAWGGFYDAFTDYKKHFGTPNQIAAKAMAVAASDAASDVPSTALADARAAWGQYGDYVGGTLNPLLSFLSFVALSIALLLQARQVGLSRIELRETRKERADAMKDAQAQLKATRTLAAAQIRTARAQERASQLLAKQLEQSAAAARAQEQSALALTRQARIASLSTQLSIAKAAEAELLHAWKSGPRAKDMRLWKATEEAFHTAQAATKRLEAELMALDA